MSKKFFWDDPYLYHSCADGIIHHRVPEVEMLVGIYRPLVGIIMVFGVHTKICIVDTIGQSSTKTLKIFPNLVTVATERVEFQRGKIFI